MNTTPKTAAVNPVRYCEECDECIHGDAHQYDGDLLCPPCWAERQASDHRDAIEEAQLEIETLEAAVAELEADYERELAELQRTLKTWRRRERTAQQGLDRLGSIAAVVGQSDGPEVGYGMAPDEHWRHPHAIPPIAGGAPSEPTEEDWADYREHFDREDSVIEDRPEPEIERPMWGYE